MNKKDIFEIMDKFEGMNIDNLHVKDGDFEIGLIKNNPQSVQGTMVAQSTLNIAPTIDNEVPTEMEKELTGKIIKSPIVGTFYASSSPEKQPFVTVGCKVNKGETIYVVEAMKMFNEVTSDFDGVVKEILVNNGENIDYGQPLMIFE